MKALITVLYYSRTGKTELAAKLVAEGLSASGNCEVHLMEVEKINKEIIVNSHAVLFGSPTYSANFAWPLKKWFDEEARNFKLKGKLAANFTTGDHIGGGADSGLLLMAGHELVRGMLVYSAGGPDTHMGAVLIDPNNDAQRTRMIRFGTNIGKQIEALFCKEV